MYKKPKILKKTLVVGIIFIFIGACILPNISGYYKKSKSEIKKDDPANFPLNDDFINTYWRFNECSGDTVGEGVSNEALISLDGHHDITSIP